MDIFVEKNNSVKAGNVEGAKVVRTVIDYINQKIEHHIQREVRDSEGDRVGFTLLHESIDLTPAEFDIWITQPIIDATTSRVDSFINPVE